MKIWKQIAQSVCSMNERQPNSQEHEDCLEWQRHKTRLLGLMWPSTQLIEKDIRASSVVHSKGGRCNFWGFLHGDDRRSRCWASRDGPQHDRSRSDTVMISMNFNGYAGLAIFLIIPFYLFFKAEYYEVLCFNKRTKCYRNHTRELYSMTSNLAWKSKYNWMSLKCMINDD